MEDRRDSMLPRGGVVIEQIPFRPIPAEGPWLDSCMVGDYPSISTRQGCAGGLTASGELSVFQVFGEKQFDGSGSWISILIVRLSSIRGV